MKERTISTQKYRKHTGVSPWNAQAQRSSFLYLCNSNICSHHLFFDSLQHKEWVVMLRCQRPVLKSHVAFIVMIVRLPHFGRMDIIEFTQYCHNVVKHDENITWSNALSTYFGMHDNIYSLEEKHTNNTQLCLKTRYLWSESLKYLFELAITRVNFINLYMTVIWNLCLFSLIELKHAPNLWRESLPRKRTGWITFLL